MEEPFAIKTASGVVRVPATATACWCSHSFLSLQEQGKAGDFLAQNEQGDQWAISPQNFTQLYEADA
jgi:hypothetical protein